MSKNEHLGRMSIKLIDNSITKDENGKSKREMLSRRCWSANHGLCSGNSRKNPPTNKCPCDCHNEKQEMST